MIVPWPMPLSIVAPVGLDSSTRKTWLFSARVSPRTWTVNVLLSSPVAKLMVPLLAT